MVTAECVESAKVDRTKPVTVLCVHGDKVEYPTAVVDLTLGGRTRQVAVGVAHSLPVPVLLGRDIYDAESGWIAPDTGYLVETRSRKRNKYSNSPRGPAVQNSNQTTPTGQSGPESNKKQPEERS